MMRVLFVAALVATMSVSSAAVGGSTVIDMPPPPRSAESEKEASTYLEDRAGVVDAGTIALYRYARARRGPSYTYGRYPWRGVYAGYGYGAYYVPGPYYGFPWFGSAFCGCGFPCLGFCGFYAFPSFVRVVD